MAGRAGRALARNTRLRLGRGSRPAIRCYLGAVNTELHSCR